MAIGDTDTGVFSRKNDLRKGGKFQGLSLKDFRGTNCSNWKQTIFNVGQKRLVKWIDLDNVDSPKDDLRKRGRNKGGATFVRGEGIFFLNDTIYFTATKGGRKLTDEEELEQLIKLAKGVKNEKKFNMLISKLKEFGYIMIASSIEKKYAAESTKKMEIF